MPYPSSRPPLTEGAAEAIAKKSKGPQAAASISEVPLAFQNRQARPSPAAFTSQRVTGAASFFKRALLGLAAVVAIGLIVIWLFG